MKRVPMMLLNLWLLIAAMIGGAIGFLLAPFVIGFRSAVDTVDDYINASPERMAAKERELATRKVAEWMKGRMP